MTQAMTAQHKKEALEVAPAGLSLVGRLIAGSRDFAFIGSGAIPVQRGAINFHAQARFG